MNFGSLFSGIGGFDLGFERAGHECVWQVEVDESCQRVLQRRFPSDGELREASRLQRFQQGASEPTDPFHADIFTASKHNLAAVDLICGGFPCQDLSVAGKRAGLDGVRSGLWFEFHRILAELRPRWVVIENVPGLLSSNGGADMAVVLGGLAELGYGWAYRVLNAQHFGVAQRRRRVFIVGHLGEPWAAPAAVLFEPESCGGNPPARGKTGQGVAGTLGGGSGERGWPADTERMTFLPIADTAAGHVVAYSKLGEPQRNPARDAAVRRLTPTECERLQGFPDGWTAGQSDSTRYRQLGNAVAVPVAEWIGRRVGEVDA